MDLTLTYAWCFRGATSSTFPSMAPAEAFDVRVLVGLPGLNVAKAGAVLRTPRDQLVEHGRVRAAGSDSATATARVSGCLRPSRSACGIGRRY